MLSNSSTVLSATSRWRCARSLSISSAEAQRWWTSVDRDFRLPCSQRKGADHPASGTPAPCACGNSLPKRAGTWRSELQIEEMVVKEMEVFRRCIWKIGRLNTDNRRLSRNWSAASRRTATRIPCRLRSSSSTWSSSAGRAWRRSGEKLGLSNRERPADRALYHYLQRCMARGWVQGTVARA